MWCIWTNAWSAWLCFRNTNAKVWVYLCDLYVETLRLFSLSTGTTSRVTYILIRFSHNYSLVGFGRTNQSEKKFTPHTKLKSNTRVFNSFHCFFSVIFLFCSQFCAFWWWNPLFFRTKESFSLKTHKKRNNYLNPKFGITLIRERRTVWNKDELINFSISRVYKSANIFYILVETKVLKHLFAIERHTTRTRKKSEETSTCVYLPNDNRLFSKCICDEKRIVLIISWQKKKREKNIRENKSIRLKHLNRSNQITYRDL